MPLIPINIVIADRSYRIKAKPEDEEAIRKALKTINDKIIEFKTQFAGKDMQDYVAMVLIWFATQTSTDNTATSDKEVLEGLLKMEAMISNL
jgi:cell division protein ZapA (FtsZ GTPase activity inhibitor)